jgi:hypothetical protein
MPVLFVMILAAVGLAPAAVVRKDLLAGPQSVLVSVPAPGQLGGETVRVELRRRGEVVLTKLLHAGDGDLFTYVGAGQGMRLEVTHPDGVAVRTVLRSLDRAPQVESEPNDSWSSATPVVLGRPVAASGDEAPYIPLGDSRQQAPAEDWFRFAFPAGPPQLLHLALDVPDRDNIPVDVSLHRVVNGKLVEYSEGEDPVALPHEVQALPGNKFTTRVLSQPGAYYIRVRMSHPAYTLITRLYPAPPYAKPQEAVQAAIDYLIGAGDSWHANTPRRGGVYDRIATPHQETTLCVACHPTHFTLRAQLYASRHGYATHYPRQLAFLAERFYNNPRPLYGFEKEGAVWSRVISAGANVLSRMSHLTTLYEQQAGAPRREDFHRGVGEYLRLYYRDRTKLPPDETNGNTPLVSTYEVAWYAWENTRDPRIAALLEQDAVKNTIDLCYQTLALAAIDPRKHQAKIAANAARLLGLQRADGQWSAKLEPESLPVEFQTGHALWTLAAAGVPVSHPQVQKGLQFLLKRQRPFGGWLDPLQTYENFRTPFRETQMAVLALSAYFPLTKPAPAPRRTKPNPDFRALGDASKLVQRETAAQVRQLYSEYPATSAQPLLDALASPDERTRWGATRVFASHFAALARRPEFAAPLARLLGDPAPAVRLQAAKALWQFWFWSPDAAARETIEDALLAALAEPQHPWIDRALREAVYNLADENIRYLYNNWVPGLARPADREQVVRGRLAVEDRLSRKFARVLEQGTLRQKKTLLTGLTEFELRRGDVYDPTADHTTPFPPVYNRIGNDVEQIVFFGEANDRLARALLPLLDHPELGSLARGASIILRDVNFGEAARLAGPLVGDREPIVRKLLSEMPAQLPNLQAWGRAPAAPRKPGAPRATATGARPDDDYFRGYVEPILTTRGKDGQACVHCHASHTQFNATLTTARNVINLEDPEQSLILLKPISDAESEGTLGAKKLAHGGGVRFEKGSPEYNTILNWIRGTKP